MNARQNPLVEEATGQDAVDGETSLRVPRTQENVFSAFSSLQDAIWAFSASARGTTPDDHRSTLVRASRKFGWVFAPAYDTDATDKTDRPTFNLISRDLSRWGDSVQPRTIIVEKAGDDLVLEYKRGFHASDETVFLKPETEQGELAMLLNYCGKGAKYIHAPFEPSVFERWRYDRDSRMAVSVQDVGDGMRIGIESDDPERPAWYPLWLVVTQLGGPHAYATLQRDKQTSVVEFTLNENGY